MGFFHCRPISPEEDFILISPTNLEELGDYRAFSKTNGWYFCKKCGVRVFGVAGKWEQTDINVEQWAGSKDTGEGKQQPVLKTRSTTRTRNVSGEEITETYQYVSVNAVTLEPSEDIDLRMWYEKGWVLYMDCRDRKGQPRPAKPYEGGMY